MKGRKSVFKMFWAWQDDREEEWLSEMAEEGWYLKSWNFFFYTFVKGEPKPVHYRLDFRPGLKRKGKEEYFTLFADAGWEVVTSCFNWYYFRGEKDKVKSPEIYSDLSSKVQKYKNIQQVFIPIMSMLFIIYFVLVIPSDGMMFFKVFYPIMLLFYGFTVLRLYLKIKSVTSLNKKS